MSSDVRSVIDNGKTAIGIATKNPVLALPDILNMAKDMVQ